MEKKALRGWSTLSKPFQKGVEKAMASETPFFLSPFLWAGKKMFGEDAVRKAVWKAQAPLIKADMYFGSLAQDVGNKIMGKSNKSIFSQKMPLPLGKAGGGYTGNVEGEVPSILAPISNTGKVVMPILGAVKLEEILKKRKADEQQHTNY